MDFLSKFCQSNGDLFSYLCQVHALKRTPWICIVPPFGLKKQHLIFFFSINIFIRICRILHKLNAKPLKPCWVDDDGRFLQGLLWVNCFPYQFSLSGRSGEFCFSFWKFKLWIGGDGGVEIYYRVLNYATVFLKTLP